MLYRISGLTKTYDDRTVLDIPELDIEKGGIHALLGPNGAGKTTLLNILGFLDKPTTGKILYASTPVRFREAYMQSLRQAVSLVDQKPILFSTSVHNNIEFGLKVRRMPKHQRDRLINEALDLVGMRHFASAQAHHLSGGETQRIAIARALAVMPSVLLCDEPTSSVDAENQAIILNILKHINEEKGITIIFTTHDRFQAALLSKNVLFLDHGRLTIGNENSYSGILTEQDDQHLTCRIQDKIDLKILRQKNDIKTEMVRVMIDPDKLLLHNIHEKNEGENIYAGRIIQVTDEREKIRVVVDIGVWISLLLTPAAYQKQHPPVGERVLVNITPESILVL